MKNKVIKDPRVSFDLFLSPAARIYISKSGPTLTDAIYEAIMEMLREGHVYRRPQSNRIKTTTRIDKNVLKKFDALCLESGLSRTEYFNHFISVKLLKETIIK